MSGQVEGLNITNEPLWQIWPAAKFGTDQEWWVGTGHDTLFVSFHDLRGAIDFFLGRFPGTVGIRSTLGERYSYADLAAAARSVYLDKVMAVIEPSQPTDETIIGGETMAAPPTPTLWDDKER